MHKIKLAVIGTGHLGSVHAKLWQQHPDVEMVAVVDPDQVKGLSVAEQYGATWYATLEEMPICDAVTIASPTLVHYDNALYCINAGMHCFIEKPLAATYEQCLEIYKLASNSKLTVQVGHVERFNAAIRALDTYEIAPLFIEGHRLAQFKPRAIDVSVIHDLMIHDIDLLLWLTKSEVVGIQATGVAVLTESPDICNARLTFASGCVANLTASRISAKPMRKLRVFQKDSYISLDLAEGSVEMYSLIETQKLDVSHQIPLGTIDTQHGNRMIVIDTPPVVSVNAIADEQASFIKSIQTGTAAAVTANEGAEAVRVAELIAKCL
ncbi:MAG: Gfo/Idh/MocA family oxidoreductase [Ignavibacteria bacterium]|nr:Gfo/Idh/MocA family oxidoreductase [Ignavibacteria bacterium]